MVTVDEQTHLCSIDEGMLKPFAECEHERRLRCYPKSEKDFDGFYAAKQGKLKICLDCAAILLPIEGACGGWHPHVFHIQCPDNFPYTALFDAVLIAVNIVRSIARSEGKVNVGPETK